MKVTLKDIAEETGYSISTVSRALNGSDKIGAKTRRAIVHTAKRLNYPIYHTLNGESNVETLKICLVISQYHVGEFYASFFYGINHAAEDHNIRLALVSLLKPFPDLVDDIRDLTRNQQYDGIILFTPELKKSDYKKLQDELPDQFPVISNGLIENPIFTTISFDAYSGGYLAAEHFSKKEYRTCGVIRGPFRKAEARYRANGFRDYIIQAPEMDIVWEYNGDFTFEAGVKAFNNFKEAEEKPRAIFACSDEMCHGFMEEAMLNSYRIPEDIAMIGFDDLPICKRHRPTISSIHTDYEKLGSVTMEAMREIVSNPKQQKGVLSLVPVDLEVRDSS